MGKVFSFAEIVNGQIPRMNSFDKAAEWLIQTVPKLDEIVEAMFFGSYANHCHNERSDLDFLMFFDCAPEEMTSITRHFYQQLKPLNVPLSILPINLKLGRLGADIDAAFCYYLAQTYTQNNGVEGYFGSFPEIGFEGQTARQAVETYLAHKFENLIAI